MLAGWLRMKSLFERGDGFAVAAVSATGFFASFAAFFAGAFATLFAFDAGFDVAIFRTP
jgi:hypothetical protein